MRRTKAIDYIKRLAKCKSKDSLKASRELMNSYMKWKRTLDLKDFLFFINLIQNKWKNIIMISLKGYPQTIGQFRAFSFEEYLRDLIDKQILSNYKDFRILWNEKFLVWTKHNMKYYSAFDIAICRNEFPIIVIEAKIDVDAPRLRAFMLNSFLFKKVYRKSRTILIYVNWNADELLKHLAKEFIDELFDFKFEDQVKEFISYVKILLNEARSLKV